MSGFVHYVALHSGSLYSRKESSTITSVPLRQPDEAATGQTRKEPAAVAAAAATIAISLLLSLALRRVHSVCCWSSWGVGATLTSHSHILPPHPAGQPPTVTAICAGTDHSWRNPTACSLNNTNMNTSVSVKLKHGLEWHDITFSLQEWTYRGFTRKHSIYS